MVCHSPPEIPHAPGGKELLVIAFFTARRCVMMCWKNYCSLIERRLIVRMHIPQKEITREMTS